MAALSHSNSDIPKINGRVLHSSRSVKTNYSYCATVWTSSVLKPRKYGKVLTKQPLVFCIEKIQSYGRRNLIDKSNSCSAVGF